MVLHKRVKLQGSKIDRITTALEMAGWFAGRSVDITPVHEYYKSRNLPLVKGAEIFYKEFYGLAKRWYIEWDYVPNRAPDFEFSLCPDNEHLNAEDFILDDTDPVIAKAQEWLTFVGEIGYHYPARVWISQSGKFITTHDYDTKIHVYYSVIELIEWELQKHDFDYVTIIE